jgi:hypothetical protein
MLYRENAEANLRLGEERIILVPRNVRVKSLV